MKDWCFFLGLEVVEHLVMATAPPCCLNGVYWSNLVCVGLHREVALFLVAGILIQRAKELKKHRYFFFPLLLDFILCNFISIANLLCNFIFPFSCSVLWFGKLYMLLIGRMMEHNPLVERSGYNNETMNLLLLKSTCLSYPSIHWKTYPQLLRPILEITTPNW